MAAASRTRARPRKTLRPPGVRSRAQYRTPQHVLDQLRAGIPAPDVPADVAAVWRRGQRENPMYAHGPHHWCGVAYAGARNKALERQIAMTVERYGGELDTSIAKENPRKATGKNRHPLWFAWPVGTPAQRIVEWQMLFLFAVEDPDRTQFGRELRNRAARELYEIFRDDVIIRLDTTE